MNTPATPASSLSDDDCFDIRFALRSEGFHGGEDQDEFNTIARAIEAKVMDRLSRGGAPTPVWSGLTKSEHNEWVGKLVDYGTGFVAPLFSVVEGIEKQLRERNDRAPSGASPAPEQADDEEYRRLKALTRPRCELPPAGWVCSRMRGHDGPCAARPLRSTLSAMTKGVPVSDDRRHNISGTALAAPMQAPEQHPDVREGRNVLRWLLNLTTDFDRKDVRTRQAARLLDEFTDGHGNTNRKLLEAMWAALSPPPPPQQADNLDGGFHEAYAEGFDAGKKEISNLDEWLDTQGVEREPGDPFTDERYSLRGRVEILLSRTAIAGTRTIDLSETAPQQAVPTAMPTQEMLDSPITELCKECREAQWCIPSRQCLVARLNKSDAFFAALPTGATK